MCTLIDLVRPICLPSYSEWNSTWFHLDMQVHCTVQCCTVQYSTMFQMLHVDMQISGWGKPTDDADGISPVLRDATVDTISNTMCALSFPINIDHRHPPQT